MDFMAMKVDSLNDLFVYDLKDLYDAENRIIEAMPSMIEAASAAELKQAFQEHLNVTKQQASRLEEIFDMLDMDPERESCDGIIGILKEGSKMAAAKGDPNTKDAALIASAQKVEHYEVASYGTLRTYARELDMDDVAEILQMTLDEEKDTDSQLTGLAERSINIQAAGG